MDVLFFEGSLGAAGSLFGCFVFPHGGLVQR